MISHRGNLRAVFDLTQRLKCLCARRDSNVKNVFKAFLAAALLALLPLVLSAAECLPDARVYVHIRYQVMPPTLLPGQRWEAGLMGELAPELGTPPQVVCTSLAK